jgi:eukaryotic-like serine/threonine-protein kinase
MVWPPPKVLGTQEGEITVERPHGGNPDASAIVPGAEPMPAAAAAVTTPAPALPGATVSVMAATAIPHDWLERPERLIGSVLGSRYRVTSVIGRGPMGIACEGESSRGRQVTLKLLPRAPELPVEHFAWQVRQALALAHFDHPNVAAISDFGPLDDGSSFVSRARTPGVTLRTILRQGGLPIGRALEICRQVASALATAHSQDIAHGRLKPENIIVHGGARPGDVIKVVDFGMAGLQVNLRAVAPNENEARRLALRTRLYLPSDASGASPAVDVYSMGVLLFEMIAGQPPFVFEAHDAPGLAGPPLSFAQCNPALAVPASVNELVSALLNPRASEQGLSAERLGQMLDALLGRPSIAAPEPVTAQMQSLPPQSPYGTDNQIPTAKVPPPDVHAFTTAGSLVWPSSPAPASTPSFPPLPQGMSSSTFPPPTVAPRSNAQPPEPQPRALPSPSSPPPPPSSRARSSGPPPLGSNRPRPPGPPPSMRHPGRVDEPFATPSFPPPAVHAATPSFPPPAVLAATPSQSPQPISADVGDDELVLRPSFIGRLKRLFVKKPPTGF